MKCTLRIFSLCCVDLGKCVRATDIYLGHKTALSHSHIDCGSKSFQYGVAQGHIQIKMSGLNRKDPLAHPHPGTLDLYVIFWPKFSICDLICHVYILFELVYNILHNKIQIWTFDSDNRIDLLQEFNYALGFFIQTGPTFNSNYFIKYFQHLTS